MSGDHSRLEVVGGIKVLLHNKCQNAEIVVTVIKGVKRSLLGIVEIRKMNLIAISRNNGIFDPFCEFSLFDSLGKTARDIKNFFEKECQALLFVCT